MRAKVEQLMDPTGAALISRYFIHLFLFKFLPVVFFSELGSGGVVSVYSCTYSIMERNMI